MFSPNPPTLDDVVCYYYYYYCSDVKWVSSKSDCEPFFQYRLFQCVSVYRAVCACWCCVCVYRTGWPTTTVHTCCMSVFLSFLSLPVCVCVCPSLPSQAIDGITSCPCLCVSVCIYWMTVSLSSPLSISLSQFFCVCFFGWMLWFFYLQYFFFDADGQNHYHSSPRPLVRARAIVAVWIMDRRKFVAFS